MRLLNTSSLQLEEFPPNQIPEYAILSHTWKDDEVLLVDMQRGHPEVKAGYKKIRYSCAQAAAQDLHYIWIDTCCIDKSSSAELSEAINSMHLWYQKAEICYAYLADVHTVGNAVTLTSTFAKSLWFSRGWTLQELIAPANLVFFSHDWIEIGKKSNLCNILADITGVDVGILTGMKPLESASVAKRMSWASFRETTRTEDIAYCLMGLFAVNMPMLYGEGENAFIRLQEEIMKYSDDQSLFAWVDSTAPADSYHGLLAASPAQFANSGSIITYRDWKSRTPFSMSNRGLRINLHLRRCEEETYVAALECPAPPDYEDYLGIYLKRLSIGDDEYGRVKLGLLSKSSGRGSIQTVYVRQHISVPDLQDVYEQHAFQLREGPTEASGYKLINILGRPSSKGLPAKIVHSRKNGWNPGNMLHTFSISKGTNRLAGVLTFQRHDGEKLLIKLGSTADCGVGFDVAPGLEIGSFEALEESFEPQAPRTEMIVDSHRVRVDTETHVHSGVKYYLVDVDVEEIYQHQSLSHKIAHQLLIPSDQHKPNPITYPPPRSWKTRIPFRTYRKQKTTKVPATS